MKRRILSIILAAAMLIPMVMGAVPVTTHADASLPSIAVYVNGTWCSAQTLQAGSGESWLTLPIPGALLVNSRENYVRITSNVANGTTDDTQVKVYMTNSTWSNSFLSEQIWVDDNWTGYTDKQVNCYIEGWDGTQWRRIHDDIDAFAADSTGILGKNSGGNYTNYARNIWVGENVVENYTAFRVKCHVYVGSSLTVNEENAGLFPAANYLSCDMCETCGGCKSDSCTLGHSACITKSMEPSVAVYLNGTWCAAQSLAGKSGETWLTFPVSETLLTDTVEGAAGNTNYLRITSNVVNGAADESQLKLYFTDTTWTNTYLTPNCWVDGDWAECTNKVANLYIEGWDGTQWRRIHNDVDAFEADSATVLGKIGDGSYMNYARNIWVDSGTLDLFSAYRVKCQVYVGSELAIHEENKDLFPAANYLSCQLCDDCGGCKSDSCTLSHGVCEGHEAVRMRVNGVWYGLYLTEELLGQDAAWVSIPIDMTGITGGTMYPVSVSSSILSTENLGTGSVDLYATAATENLESFTTNNAYCDDGFVQYTDRNINVKLEGWDGHQWVDLSAADQTYSTDFSTVLGQFSVDNSWYNAARNITLKSDLSGISAMRVSMQLHIGANVQAAPGFVESNFATFPEAQTVTAHAQCAEHSGYCTVDGCAYSCAKLHVVDPITSWSLSLGDAIGANFYVKLSEEEAATAVMNFTVDGKTTAVKASDAAIQDGYYVFCADVAAAQMTETISLELVVNEQTVQTGSYTVRGYAEYILKDENSEFDAATKALVKAMLNYGAKAQVYFGYNTDNLANANYEEAAPAAVPTEIDPMAVDGAVDGIRYYGATLLFDSKTTVRYYFDVAGDIGSYTFTVDGKTCESGIKNGRYYVDVDGITPQKLDEVVTVTVTDGTSRLSVSYSPMHYIVRMYGGSDNLNGLLQAMYNYHLAAVDAANEE